jgi:glycosyltransferase involved in cell wall biosynthesis
MRILNVTQTYFPFLEFGGPPVKVRALSEALAQRGHQVTVLTADWGLEERATLGNVKAPVCERSRFGWEVRENGVEAVYLPTRFRSRALSWNPGLKRFCRERVADFDIVHIFGLYDFLGPAAASSCRRNGVPYVVEPIGMFVPIVRSVWRKRMYHLFLGHRMLAGSRSIIATSEQEASELQSAGMASGKIVLRRNGVEVPKAFPERGMFRAGHGIPADVKLILFLGRLSAKKSPEVLLQAYALLCNSTNPADLRLVFAGPDEAGMRARLEAMAERLGISGQVYFCGALFGADKWAAYRDCDIFVLPSQNENFGNTAAEALAAGTPVVVTDKCGIAPLLKEVGGLVVPHDTAAISVAIGRILFEPGLHARLARGCKEVASGLDWEQPALQMEALYAQLVAGEWRTVAAGT